METSNLTISERINNLPAYYSRIFDNMRVEDIDVKFVRVLEAADYIDRNGENGLETYAIKVSAIGEMSLNDIIKFLDFYRRHYEIVRTDGIKALYEGMTKLLANTLKLAE